MAQKIKRRSFSEKDVIATLLHQGVQITDFRTGEAITLENLLRVQREHLVELAMVEEAERPKVDQPKYCRYSLAENHKVITHGNGATFAGSSRHKIKKATDPDRIEKFAVKKRPPRLKPLDADRLAAPSGRCAGCGECREACACPPKRKPQGFGKRRTA